MVDAVHQSVAVVALSTFDEKLYSVLDLICQVQIFRLEKYIRLSRWEPRTLVFMYYSCRWFVRIGSAQSTITIFARQDESHIYYDYCTYIVGVAPYYLTINRPQGGP